MEKKVFEYPTCAVSAMVCEDIMATSGWLTSNLGFIFGDETGDTGSSGYTDEF